MSSMKERFYDLKGVIDTVELKIKSPDFNEEILEICHRGGGVCSDYLIFNSKYSSQD